MIVLRHLVATLAYRAAKVLRDVPPGFATASAGVSTRQPVQIIGHMADLMAWAITMAQGDHVWKAGGSGDWDTEVTRFFDGLGALDRELAARDPAAPSVEQLIQGPLADALTHVGQLAMLRASRARRRGPRTTAAPTLSPGASDANRPRRAVNSTATRAPGATSCRLAPICPLTKLFVYHRRPWRQAT